MIFCKSGDGIVLGRHWDKPAFLPTFFTVLGSVFSPTFHDSNPSSQILPTKRRHLVLLMITSIPRVAFPAPPAWDGPHWPQPLRASSRCRACGPASLALMAWSTRSGRWMRRAEATMANVKLMARMSSH